ncbi:RES family NAD+ phosphorylase [Salinarimonas chemoclinalis]|uniref:RES family NAD+ phosphorylase n=1 Tax=Salinarimonas chemoclinalis TaxID=3241599 RepID=UPI0035579A7D
MSGPRPPRDLAARVLETTDLPAGAELHRFFTAAYDPIHFDRSDGGRLNAPDGSYGVLYAAQSIRGAFAETFLRVPGRRLLPRDLLATKAYVRLRAERPVRIAVLHGQGLARAGATAEVTHGGRPYAVPQAWSRALRDHPARPEGIAYRARHDDDEICYALYDGVALSETERRTALDADWFWRLADRYGVGLSPF